MSQAKIAAVISKHFQKRPKSQRDILAHSLFVKSIFFNTFTLNRLEMVEIHGKRGPKVPVIFDNRGERQH